MRLMRLTNGNVLPILMLVTAIALVALFGYAIYAVTENTRKDAERNLEVVKAIAKVASENAQSHDAATIQTSKQNEALLVGVACLLQASKPVAQAQYDACLIQWRRAVREIQKK